MSNAAARWLPSASLTRTAVAGVRWSGVSVATTMRSMSSGSRPATATARLPAMAPMVAVVSCGRGDAPLADTGAAGDPLVGGVHDAGQVVVGEHGLRGIRTPAGDADAARRGHVGSTSMSDLVGLDQGAALGGDAPHHAGHVTLDLVEQLHRLQQADDLAGVDLAADTHVVGGARRRGAVEDTRERRHDGPQARARTRRRARVPMTSGVAAPPARRRGRRRRRSGCGTAHGARRMRVVSPASISISDRPDRAIIGSSRSMSAMSSVTSAGSAGRSRHQASQRRSRRAEFWPPNPNAFTSATRTSRSRAWSGVRSMSPTPGSGSVRLSVGGTQPWCIAEMTAISRDAHRRRRWCARWRP